MSKNTFKISMQENGEHSLLRGIEAYQDYEQNGDHMLLKDAIMFLHHGIELLMKEILVRRSPYLIFEDLKNLPKKQKLADQKGMSIFSMDEPPKTVSYEVAIDRVEAFIKPPELDKPLLDNLSSLTKLRNKLEHHEIEADREEVVKLLLAIHDPALRLFEAQFGKFEQFHTPQVDEVWNSIVRFEKLLRYPFIRSIRPTDGARLVAKRIIVDANTPIRWSIVMTNRVEQFIFDELPLFEDAEGRVQKQYLSRELSQLAEKAGFRDWEQSPIAMVEAIEQIGKEYRKRLIPQYQLPDPTDYPME